jgi:hypothetical protein
METGLVRDAEQMKQCVCTISRVTGRCYTGKTSRPLEVCIKEHKYNLTQGLLEKSKLVQHAYEEGHKICWIEVKVLQIEPNTAYRKYKESTHIHSVNLAWTSLPSGLPLLQQKSKNYKFSQCRL